MDIGGDWNLVRFKIFLREYITVMEGIIFIHVLIWATDQSRAYELPERVLSPAYGWSISPIGPIHSCFLYYIWDRSSRRTPGCQICTPCGHAKNERYRKVSNIRRTLVGNEIVAKVSNITRTLVGNEIVDHSDVVGASPIGAAPTTSSFST